MALARYRSRHVFFLGLHRMIQAGVALPIAFAELSRGAEREGFARAVAEVGRDVAAGAGLAEAMRRRPHWFDPQAVTLLGAAEATGTLESALARIVTELEEAQALRWRVLARCAYPGYLLGAFLLAGSLLATAASLVSGGGGVDALVPLFLGHLVRRLLLVSGGALVLFLLPLVLATPAVAPTWERLREALPGVRGVYRALQASRFCFVLGASQGAGLEVGQSLHLALEATGGEGTRARARRAAHSLQSGASLTDVVGGLGVLDAASLQRLSIGELTGHVAPTLTQLGREHADTASRRLSVLLFGLVVVLSVALFATHIRALVHFQGSSSRQLEGLGRE